MPIGLIIIIIILAIIIIWYISAMNGIRHYDIKVQEAASGIDVALTKRYDVLTKQLEVVKQYTTYESKTLFESIRIRSGMTMAERQEASSKMDEVGQQFKLVAEAYPELKSSNNYLQLQKSINDVEEHLQAARRAYNANVSAYNTRIIMFPASIVAGMIGAKAKEMFVAEEYKRQDVEMKF